MNDFSDIRISRRGLLKSGVVLGSVPALKLAQAGSGANTAAPVMAKVSFTVNGQPRQLEVDTRTTLLDVRRINACLSLAVMHEGARITTIEGLGTPARLHPMQAAFIRHDGYQCGYCAPGQICSAVAVLDEIRRGVPSHVSASLTEQPLLSVDEIRERMSGNLCRCGAYSNIVEAISVAGGQP